MFAVLELNELLRCWMPVLCVDGCRLRLFVVCCFCLLHIVIVGCCEMIYVVRCVVFVVCCVRFHVRCALLVVGWRCVMFLLVVATVCCVLSIVSVDVCC